MILAMFSDESLFPYKTKGEREMVNKLVRDKAEKMSRLK